MPDLAALLGLVPIIIGYLTMRWRNMTRKERTAANRAIMGKTGSWRRRTRQTLAALIPFLPDAWRRPPQK